MKRLLVLLALLGALAAPARVAAQNIPVGIGGQLSSLVNLPITVPVVVDLTGRTDKLGSYAFRLTWNPAVLQVLGGSDGTFGNATVNQDSLPFGVARVAGVNPAGAGGLVTLVNVQLLPLVKDTTTLSLAVSGLWAAGTFADLLPSATVTGGLFCPARGRWGDIDGDGNANSRDALIALSNAVGLDVSAFDIGLGDVDANGATNARDALIVLSNAVGIDPGTFRVMRLAGGSCSSNAPVAMTITPAAVELVVGQSVHFEAWAPDSATGAMQALVDATWRSGSSSQLVMGPTGDASARDTGTVTVTAYRGTRDSVRTTAHIVARRTTHWVDAVAANAKNRLGSPALPFGSFEEGLLFAQEGDTLRVRVGRYQPEQTTLTPERAVVIIGDTAADGSRPTLAGPGPNSTDGVDLYVPGRTELQYLDLEGFSTGVYVGGADCVLLRGVRMRAVTTGVYVGSPAACVRIESSTLLGTSPQYAYGQSIGGVVADAALDTLVVRGTEVAGFSFGLLLIQPPASTAVSRSSVHDNVNAAFSNSVYGGGGGAPPVRRAPRPTATRAASPPVRRGPMGGGNPLLVVDSSRVERTTYSYNPLFGLNGGTLDLVVAHSWLSNPGGDVFYLYASGGSVSLRGDSIIAPAGKQHSYWMYGYNLDSLVVDSLQLAGASYGYAYYTPRVQVTNSTLRDVRSVGLNATFASGTGGVFTVDNVGVYGDARDDASADGFVQAYGRIAVSRFTGENLLNALRGVYTDSSFTVLNSTFRHVRGPVGTISVGAVGPDASLVTVRGSTFDGYEWGVQVYNVPLVADSNVFTGGSGGAVYADTQRPITVTRNQVNGVGSAIELYSFDSTAVVTVADNVITGASSKGIYAAEYGVADTLRTRIDVRRNSVSCDATGATSAAGIDLYDVHMFVADNQVANCWAGIRAATNLAMPRTDTVLGNTVTVPASAQLGIGVAGNLRARLGRNTVSGPRTGTQSYGLIDVGGGCSWYCLGRGNVPVALVDSNTVTGGTVWGIRATYVDSVTVAGNTVTNLTTPTGAYGYSEDQGGIALLGALTSAARVVGNVVRHIAGNGIVVDHPSTDTTIVLVDSNVVADIDSTAVLAALGPAWITRNLVNTARRDGIRVPVSNYDSLFVGGNNIYGNLRYGLNNLADRSGIWAPDNWWGSANGPRCGYLPCDTSVAGVGDSVSNVNFTPFRTAPNDTVPPMPVPAPRMLAAQPAPAAPAGSPASTSTSGRTTWRAPAPVGVRSLPPQAFLAAQRTASEGLRAQAEAAAAERERQLQARRAERERARQAPPPSARRQEVRP